MTDAKSPAGMRQTPCADRKRRYGNDIQKEGQKMTFDTHHQRFPGHPGDWNLVRAYGDTRYTLLEYESDAPGNRKRITLDGSTGKIIRVTERKRES